MQALKLLMVTIIIINIFVSWLKIISISVSINICFGE